MIGRFALFLAVFLAPLLALAQAATPDLGADVTGVIDAVRAGQAIAIAGAVVMLLTNLLKHPLTGGLVKKIPARWRFAIPVVLGGVAGILSSVAGGVGWQEAVMIGLFTGPVAVFQHETVVEAILGRSTSRAGPAGEQ